MTSIPRPDSRYPTSSKKMRFKSTSFQTYLTYFCCPRFSFLWKFFLFFSFTNLLLRCFYAFFEETKQSLCYLKRNVACFCHVYSSFEVNNRPFMNDVTKCPNSLQNFPIILYFAHSIKLFSYEFCAIHEIMSLQDCK